MLVESLQVQRSQVCQRDAADLRLDVVFQKALAGLERGRSEFYSGVVLNPDLQSTPHGVGLGPSVVDADIFLDGFFQFFFYFRLRLAEDVFDDGLSGFRIVTDCVATLPSAVFPLADVPFPVCSSLWHGISPFRNEQYRNQGNKATRKSNCYQKVIICAPSSGEPYLCLLRRKFCAAGGVLFGYCKADFKPSSMQAICLYLRKGQTVFSIYLFDLFSDLRIDAETEHIRLGRCHNVFHFGFLLT